MLQSLLRKAAFWNMMAGLTNAGQSAVLLVFITGKLGMESAGIFTIAYAIGNLFSTISKYGIRNFQITDTKEKYSFADYLVSRKITIFMTMLLMILYIFIQYMTGKNTGGKLTVILLVSLWRFIDAAEDVFFALYQKCGRLDLGSQCYLIRSVLSTIVFCVFVLIGMTLQQASFYTLLCSMAAAFFLIRVSMKQFPVLIRPAGKGQIRKLLRECFPLCIGSSISVYVGNAPKYLIDRYQNETMQAYFAFLMMPAFAILLLSSFIYQPFVKNLGDLWQSGNKRVFLCYVMRQGRVTAVITGCVTVAGTIIGLPVLSWFYHVNLTAFREEFMILIVGGGIYAFVSFMMISLTSMRLQKCIAWCFLAAALYNVVFGKCFVIKFGIMGAALSYLAQNSLLALSLSICLIVAVCR